MEKINKIILSVLFLSAGFLVGDISSVSKNLITLLLGVLLIIIGVIFLFLKTK
ncbi:MAG: hypothetical protein QW273_03580 [Candidatus Pacearchaeota archaeon]